MALSVRNVQLPVEIL